MDAAEGLSPADQVRSRQFGIGRVEYDKGPTTIVRFDHGLEECAKADLEVIVTPLQAVERGRWDAPLEVIARIQAEAIRSVNDAWGVFSRSKIALLPHQLWVCRRVLE
ncbi:DEAD/DEAH box helicase, partial [Singulisphaera rosea]